MDLEHKAIERLQEAARLSEFYYQAPLLLAYSGVKDSEVCLELCRRAGVPFEVVHNLTTADAPETIYHVKNTFRRLELEGVRCEILSPCYKGQPVSMWTLIPLKRVPPTRHMRYCCAVAKEGSNHNRSSWGFENMKALPEPIQVWQNCRETTGEVKCCSISITAMSGSLPPAR